MSKYLVGIDAGHSLVTGGKCTPPILETIKDKQGNVLKKKGQIIHEYEFNKKVSYALGDALKRCNIGVAYSGFKDKTDTPLGTRAKHLNSLGVDLVVSNHFNASGNCTKFQTRVKGLLVLKTKGCSSKSVSLANKVHAELKEALQPERDYGVVQDTEMCGFTLAILRQTNAPAILIEYGFMDYWKEAKHMLDEDYIEKCAEATARGICKQLGVKYVAQNTDDKIKYLRVIADKINIHNKANFNSSSVVGEVEKGDVFTITQKIERTGTDMYKLKSGVYITSSEKYVEIFEQ
ncbi:N-acetylmuramoyl-L-alanine amidase [Intestinibacter bartlettii]|uniref:N-acetylmuramoyl-L-alanine amidase n=1 Tax=Intestinibacter bartlettii CAG:1329 TaxID=1263063 RepID=R5X8P1_9FIRM|nr:N-acetylmuramoyl-L-alanine amidase [Intestinibacter bartlettii]CDA11180.1 n-acetylmuramoyl-L-alanine amidase [Intestinibacter bartlettii CAG:1329]